MFFVYYRILLFCYCFHRILDLPLYALNIFPFICIKIKNENLEQNLENIGKYRKGVYDIFFPIDV